MSTATKKKSAVPPTRRNPPPARPATREELEAQRGGVICTGPSGTVYKVRKLDPRRFALAGHLPTELLDIALDSNPRAVKQKLAENDLSGLAAFQEHLDRLVCATIIEPQVTPDDLGGDDPLIPVVDQEWAVALAQGYTENDGQGRRIWGPEQPAAFDVYREAYAKRHGCPDNCRQCDATVDEVVRHFSPAGAM